MTKHRGDRTAKGYDVKGIKSYYFSLSRSWAGDKVYVQLTKDL
jgi:hypothetical protein